jgi:Tfp pilus assembly protein PilW
MKLRNAFTLFEMVFTLVLISFLVSSVVFLYIVTIRGWDEVGHRTNIHEKLHFALEQVVRDVRNANAVSVANQALRFTLYEGGTNNSYIYYLHNASDTWVPAYNQTSYDLRRAALTGGINGTFTYGSGTIIATELLPPTGSTTITSSGNIATLNLVGTEGGHSLSVRGNVRPRNV